ncbi:hypothetical protein HPP92_010517 [Vanilla planifolia]|uniref:Uncharacterized protein n=1 Tax=Vanilla planifolia TaxID=51239 RepID=A0A835QVV1_VANPL|nr:hypothetical protein HPP92_010517 [Vanilla planifolia]
MLPLVDLTLKNQLFTTIGSIMCLRTSGVRANYIFIEELLHDYLVDQHVLLFIPALKIPVQPHCSSCPSISEILSSSLKQLPSSGSSKEEEERIEL